MKTVAGLVLLAMLAVSCTQVRVRTDFDRSVAFSGFQDFTWVKPIRRREGDRYRFREGSLHEQRVLSAIREALQARGLTFVSPGRADLAVTYRVVFREKRVASAGPGWVRPGWRRPVVVRTFREGTLIIDVMDARNRRLVWRGWAEGAFGGGVPRDQQIREAVNAILAEFPPAGGR